jgi:hypothetical protein
MGILIFWIFWLLFGFGGVFVFTHLLKPDRRPFGSILLLVCSVGFLFFITLYLGTHFDDIRCYGLPLVAAGGVGAVLFFHFRRPHA